MLKRKVKFAAVPLENVTLAGARDMSGVGLVYSLFGSGD
jgi:hypothetical protein